MNDNQQCGTAGYCSETTEPTAEEIAEMSALLGGPVQPIVLTQEDRIEVEQFIAFVDKYGRQP